VKNNKPFFLKPLTAEKIWQQLHVAMLTILYALFGITTRRKLVCRGVGFLTVAAMCLGVACNTAPPKPEAKATAKTGAASPVSEAIATAKAEAQTALLAVEQKVIAAEAQLAAIEKRSAVAAAQVRAAQFANTNAPVGPAREIVAGETGLALGNLPPPDVKEELEAAKRRTAIEAGKAAEAEALYKSARSESEQMKTEAAKLRTDAATAQQEAKIAVLKAESAQAALSTAEKSNLAALERNRAANQALLDAAEARADAAEERAKSERHKLIFRSLLGLGISCIVAGIALGVITSGTMLLKSLMLAGAGALCIGLASVISHPLFDIIFGTCIGVACIGGGFYLWHERRDAMKRTAFEKQSKLLDKVDLDAIPLKDEDGKDSTLRREFLRKMTDGEKAVVKLVRATAKVKEAEAESGV